MAYGLCWMTAKLQDGIISYKQTGIVMNMKLLCFSKSYTNISTIHLILGCAAPSPKDKDEPEPTLSGERTFSMGFTRWPSEISLKGIKQADDFIAKHADLVSIMFIGGIPWQEALDDKPFSQGYKK